MKTIIFDIDGTLADNKHRSHHIQKEPKDWNAFFEAMDGDEPIKTVFRIMEVLDRNFGFDMSGDFKTHRTSPLIFVTGRTEKYRENTVFWLKANFFKSWGFARYSKQWLYMRKDGDHRPDHIVKREILEQLQLEGHDILCAFEDRKSCVDMYRENGILCFQVADGDF